MTSMVQGLMNDSLTQSISPANLLLKALAVARKPRVIDFENWTKKELEG